MQERLALLGGESLGANLVAPRWPPSNGDTASKLADIYLSGDWSFNRGGQAAALCREFAAMHDAEHGVLMVNGTVTLMCALAVHGIGPGDEVIVPAFTWLATAMAAKYVGAKIVFADVEPSNLCLDPAKVEAAITKRTKAIIPVHFLGSTADMDAILDIAQRYNLIVIEDCAQVHGSKWNGRGVGSLGHVSSFSFQHNKIVSGGEGGICLTNDVKVFERLYRMAHIGYAPGEVMGDFRSKPEQGLVCYNFRCTEFQALIIRDQLASLSARVGTYSRNKRRLAMRLADIPGVRVQAPGRRADPQTSYKWALIFDQKPLADVPIDVLLKAIRAEGLPMEPSYGTVYQHTLFNLARSDYALPEEGCPVAERIAAQRTIMLAHQWLGADPETIELIGDIIAKVALNGGALRSAAGKPKGQ